MPNASKSKEPKARSPRAPQNGKITKKPWYQDLNKDKVRRFLMGTKDRKGFLPQLFIFLLLICIGFIYLYPILHMVSSSFMSLDDLLDSSIKWLPSKLDFSNYLQAAQSMDFWNALVKSIIIAGVPTLCNLVSCAIIGYGLARFNFPSKPVCLVIIVLTFVLPSQITMIPTYSLYNDMGILGTIWAFVLPSSLGMGINAPIFILIFWQFFRQIPKVLIEAAKIDGAGQFKAFMRVALPSAKPAFITVALFSFVWYWNESYLTDLYVQGVLTDSGWTTLVLQLQDFATNYNQYQQSTGGGAASLNESISMAGTMLSILPLLIMYFVLQRHFVESIDRTGITGE